ncbi:hypothetical protein [Ilumatobacter nonamiensis]|uniref:hypothetical protein n=1 Tax=Ilumatobacter nonamiensis TaxID=467093 RepID=UPI00034AA182|nr:hypothetical protein [Ilumatobacter nonamiensis]
MTTIVLGGDCSTTTALAIAAGWPTSFDEADLPMVVVEADPTGGSLAAWLDTPLNPSLSSVVTALRQADSSGATPTTTDSAVDALIRRSSSGVRFIPAPFRTREARGVIAEADGAAFPLLSEREDLLALVEVGRLDPLRLPGALRSATFCLMVHRQDSSSAAAATVRLERLAETVAALGDTGRRVGLAVIGDAPFGLDEIVDFVAPSDGAWVLPVDPLSAAVLAGRSGVSARRLARLPLMRSTALIAADLHSVVTAHDTEPSRLRVGEDVG